MSEMVFIAGASARAAAQSARRAGLRVTAADLFADADLRSCATAIRVSSYPLGLCEIAAQIPPAAWMYTGGLENEPDLVDAISHRHVLWGNGGQVLRQIRDPWRVASALEDAGLRCPPPHAQPCSGGRWVQKPLAGCGGAGIRLLDRPTSPAMQLALVPSNRASAATLHTVVERDGVASPDRWYYQPWIPGDSYSAVFLAGHGRAALLGITRQLVGCRWAGSRDFQYVGSIGPVSWDRAVRSQFTRIGDCLAAAFGLRGLFGIDAIVTDGEVWTVEVNPRYTASVEVLERASSWAALALHREACVGNVPACPDLTPVGASEGKAVVYAPCDCRIEEAFYAQLRTTAPFAATGEFADLPAIGTAFAAGQPVLTVFASGHCAPDVERRLRVLAQAIHRYLHAPESAETAVDRDDGSRDESSRVTH